MVAIVHRYKGEFDWEGVDASLYPPEKEMQGVSIRRLIGPAEGAHNFALRYFEIEPGGWSSLDQHVHDHGVVILRGKGKVFLGGAETQVCFGDIVYIPPREVHQLRNDGEEPLGFLCVIPAREKSS